MSAMDLLRGFIYAFVLSSAYRRTDQYGNNMAVGTMLMGGATSSGGGATSAVGGVDELLRTSSTQSCKDRFGSVDFDRYRRRACVLCYFYLFPGTDLTAEPSEFLYLISRNHTDSGTSVVNVDPVNQTSIDFVCSFLDPADCTRWKLCFQAAQLCCNNQITSGVHMTSSRLYCPSTWDGYSCWEATLAGSNVRTPCPSYMERSIPTQYSMKHCTSNGSWFMKEGYEWTDYTPCLDKQGYVVGVYISVAFNVLSMIMLVPAIGLFTFFRDLFRQDRIRLHVHFFVSLTLVSVVSLMWYSMVHHDLLVTVDNSDTSVIRLNPVWCRVMSFFKIYFAGTNYSWMFCEGYHLHRLISNAFEAPGSMLGLYVIGWISPLIFSIIYACVRISVDNESCWTKNVPGYQWIIYTPNLICLVINLAFLLNILKTLLFQLHAHPHEPSNFRRGLKAGFMLVPLFGVQLLLTIYRPDLSANADRLYEYVTFAVVNSQGMFVSLIFCFFNGEVITHLRRLLPGFGSSKITGGGVSHVTHMTVADYGGGNKNDGQMNQCSMKNSVSDNSCYQSNRRSLVGDDNFGEVPTDDEMHGRRPMISIQMQDMSNKKSGYIAVPTTVNDD